MTKGTTEHADGSPSAGGSPSASGPGPRASWGVHLLILALLGGLFAYVVVARYVRPLRWGESITVERGRVGQVETRIDPNEASWAELARLPEIGEVTARRIVAFREERRSATGEGGVSRGVVFTAPEDLEAVRGIGPKTVARLRDHLRFPAPRPGR